VFVAENSDNKIVVGLIGVMEQHIFSNAFTASIMHIDVVPEARMGGYGVRLIKAFEQWAKNRDAFENCFGVNSGTGNELQPLIERLGHQFVGGNFMKRTSSLLLTLVFLTSGFAHLPVLAESSNKQAAPKLKEKSTDDVQTARIDRVIEIEKIRTFVEAEDASIESINQTFGTTFRRADLKRDSSKVFTKSFPTLPGWRVLTSKAFRKNERLYQQTCKSVPVYTRQNDGFPGSEPRGNGDYLYGTLKFPLDKPYFNGMPRVFVGSKSAQGLIVVLPLSRNFSFNGGREYLEYMDRDPILKEFYYSSASRVKGAGDLRSLELNWLWKNRIEKRQS
jgi:hypothetical protein